MLRLTAVLLPFLVLCTCSNKVKLRDVTSITLRHGDYTTAHRAPAVPQLKCVGGTAKGRFEPKVVQCYNQGYDGGDVQWECKAELNKVVEFGKIQVSCEGYDYADDPYVLKGSCGLEYELDYVEDYFAHRDSPPSLQKKSTGEWNFTEKLMAVGVISLVLYILYSFVTSRREESEGDSAGSGFQPYSGNGPDRHPPPPGPKINFDVPPPPYEDARKCGGIGSSGMNQHTSNNGPGFFSGLGLGALAGYAFGNSQSDYNDFRRREPFTYEQRNGSLRGGPSTSRRSPSPASRTETRASSGFGGTTRR